MDQGKHAESRPSLLRKALVAIVFVVFIFLVNSFSNEYLVQAYAVPSGSMEPTIETGEHVYAEQISYYFRDVEPGDINLGPVE